MTDTFIANGKELHAGMMPMLDARKAAGPAGTIAEPQIAWEKYSDALSKPLLRQHDDRPSTCTHGRLTVRDYRPAGASDPSPGRSSTSSRPD